MFTSFNEQEFWQAIRNKEYGTLKTNTVSAILNDPTFDRGEAGQVLDILKKNCEEIFEKEVHLDYEERLEPNQWDKRYFTKLTYWFQENFAESRVPYIEKVGKTVHKDTAQIYNKSMTAGTSQQKNHAGQQHQTLQTKAQPQIKLSLQNELPKVPTPSKEQSSNPQNAPAQSPKKSHQLIGALAAVAGLVLLIMLLIKFFGK